MLKNYVKSSFVLLLLIAFSSFAQDKLQTIVQTGHYSAVLGVDYSANGSLIATASQDNTIKLWEVATGRELRTFKGHTESVYDIRFSPNGTQLISIGSDDLAILWEVNSGREVYRLKDSTDEIRSAIFSPKGNYILTGGHRTNMILWDRANGKKMKTFKTKPEVCYQCASDLKFTDDEKTIISSSSNRSTVFWDVQKGDTIRTLQFNKGSCSSCNTYHDIDPTGNFLVKADRSGGLYQVNLKTGKKLKQLAEKEDFYGIQYHPSGKYLLAQMGYYGQVRVLEAKNGKVIRDFKAHKRTRGMCYSPDGKYIVTVGEDNTAKLWQSSTGKLVRTFEGIVTDVKDERFNSSELYYINLLKDTELSPDGKKVAQCKKGHAAIIWDFYTGRILKKLEGHQSVVTCLAFSPDGKTIATGSADRHIKIWDVESGALLKSIEAHSAMVLSIKFSKDGKQLISGSWDGLFKVWDIASSERISMGKVHEGSPYAVDFTPNGLYAVTAGLDKTIKITELDSRTEVRSLIGHTNITPSVAFNPKGDVLLTSSWDGYVKLWNVQTGWQLKKLSGHQNAVYSALYDSTGQYIITGSEDKTAKLWNAHTGELIRTFNGHNGGVTYATVTPNGKYVLTSSRDRTVKIWNLKSGKELITHITLDENHWMAKSPSGFFEGSNEATKTLFFVKGNKSFSLDQFFEEYYQPGVLQQSISMNTRSVEPSNILKLLEESPPPLVEILAPLEIDSVKTNHVEIISKITNTGGDINEIRILQNGKRLNLENKLSRTPKKGQDMIKNHNIRLVPGQNEISITAFSKGRVESKPVKLSVYYEGPKRTANLYIMAVGINEYKNPVLSLNYAKADAEAFVKSVEQRSKKLFKNVETTLLLNKEATKDNIMTSLSALQQKVQKEDVFYFYYAGHGGTVKDEFYFIPTENVSLYQEDKLNQSAISATALNQKLRDISALKQLIVLDACHSGASTKVLASRGMLEEKALAQLARSTGIHIMAAAGSEQQAVEFGKLGHGVFTYALLEALNGKADGAPKDNKVTVYELKSFIDDQVPELSKEHQGNTQYPNTFSLGQDFPVILVK